MQNCTLAVMPLEIAFSPGKDRDCHLLSTRTEMGGPAKEKKKVLISSESTICYHRMDRE